MWYTVSNDHRFANQSVSRGTRMWYTVSNDHRFANQSVSRGTRMWYTVPMTTGFQTTVCVKRY